MRPSLRARPTVGLKTSRLCGAAPAAAAGWSSSRRSKARALGVPRRRPGSGSTAHDRRPASRRAPSIASASSRAPEHEPDNRLRSPALLRPRSTPRSRASSPSKTANAAASDEHTKRRWQPTPRSPAVRDPQIPIGALAKRFPPTSPRFPPWEAFERRPRRAPNRGEEPAPETLHLLRRSPFARQLTAFGLEPEVPVASMSDRCRCEAEIRWRLRAGKASRPAASAIEQIRAPTRYPPLYFGERQSSTLD